MHTADQVARALRDAFKAAGLTYPALRDRLAEINGKRPTDMWLSRRLTGDVPLVKTVEIDPDLPDLARALDVPLPDVLGTAAVELPAMIAEATRERDRQAGLVARYQRERRMRALHYARVDLERVEHRLEVLHEVAARVGT